jgi:hypothetical protein
MFGGGQPGCTASVATDVGLAVGRCGCPEYTTDRAAFGEEPPIVEIVELRLGTSGEPPPGEVSRLAPRPDLFDSEPRSSDESELDGVPWRPPS